MNRKWLTILLLALLVVLSAGCMMLYRGRVAQESCTKVEQDASPAAGYLVPEICYAGCAEFPTIEINDSTVSVSGIYEDDIWHATPTANEGQTLVTHTFVDGERRSRTLSLLYDEEKRCALWVACAFNNTTFASKGIGRNEKWTWDPALPKDVQPDLISAYRKDSLGNSYSRGHQVASNDRQTTLSQNNQTFFFSNMTPQNQSLNGGQWAKLEAAVQQLGQSVDGKDTLYMVTGPLFDDGYGTTTDRSGKECAIPSRFFKALMICSYDDAGKIIAADGVAYLTSGNSKAANTPFETWITSIDEIEALTGFDLFANVPVALQEAAEHRAKSLFHSQDQAN